MDIETKQQITQELKKHIENYTQNWLDNMKDTLLLQLIGFIENKKNDLEHTIGSGEVQKLMENEILEKPELERQIADN